jgi:hypothetical protein
MQILKVYAPDILVDIKNNYDPVTNPKSNLLVTYQDPFNQYRAYIGQTNQREFIDFNEI